MVFTTDFLLAQKIFKRMRKHLRGTLIDSLRVHCIGGTGGSGLPKYGGIGGQGGCVCCIGEENVSLNNVSKAYNGKQFIGKNGEHSLRRKLVGSPGEDIIIKVPLGVTIFSDNTKIGEINSVGETCILARGGPGGTQNNGFIGYEGQKRTIVLDLKLIADVGFVGFPNAGKSTLLKVLSRAKPRIAAYPFTTIRPNLGQINYPDFRTISVADLPGLIEGAHINIGMGHSFLKHVERTKLLMLIADIQGFRLSPRHIMRTCFQTILLLNKELEMYNPDLLSKPTMLVINKMDTDNALELFEEIKEKLLNIKEYVHELPTELQPSQFLNFDEILGVSAIKNGDDIKNLKNVIRSLLDIYEKEIKNEDTIEDIKNQIKERGATVS